MQYGSEQPKTHNRYKQNIHLGAGYTKAKWNSLRSEIVDEDIFVFQKHKIQEESELNCIFEDRWKQFF